MVTGIIGRKVGMTQIFDAGRHRASGHGHQGRARASSCRRRTRRPTATRRCSSAWSKRRRPRPTSRLAGHFKKANVPATRVRREVEAGAPGGRDAEGRRPGAGVDLRQRRARRHRRHRPRQGLSGRREAAPLRRRRGDARVDVPPRARIDWRLVVSVARHQGHARRGTDGRRPRDDSQPEGAARRPRQPPADRRRRHSGRADRAT